MAQSAIKNLPHAEIAFHFIMQQLHTIIWVETLNLQ